MKRILVVVLCVIGMFLYGPVHAGLNDGLVAYYPFNGNAEDGSGNGNHGTAKGATLTNDRFGNAKSAYYFDGSNDRIDINDSYSLDIGTSDYSIVAWIKTSATSQNGRIFSKGSSSCVTGYMMRMGGTGSSNVHLENAYSGSCKVNYWGNTTVNDGQWHLVVGIVDRDYGGKIYVDGVFDSEDIIDTSSYDLSNSRNPAIGINEVNGLEPFTGSIDDVRIYNRVLTETEIQEIYTNSSTAGSCDDYDTGYQTGYQEGMAYCKNNPSACGISTNGGSTTCPSTPTGAITLNQDLSFTIPELSYQTLIGSFDLEATFEFVGDSEGGGIIWRLGDYKVK